MYHVQDLPSELVIMLVAFVGAMKTTIDYDANKPFCTKCVDTLVGLIVGVALSMHILNDDNFWLSVIVALIGGVMGALVVDVLKALVPKSLRQLAGVATESAANAIRRKLGD